MSLILDALRKSERTRQQTLTGQLSVSESAPRRARIPVPWAMLIGILLVANAIVLTIIFWHAHTSQTAGVVTEARQPAASVPPITTPGYRPEIRSLAVEAAGNNPADTAAMAAGSGAVPLTNLQRNPSVTTSAAVPSSTFAPAITAASLNTPIASASAGNPPLLDTLPLEFQQSLPPLHLDVHGYSQKPADRFVIINMRRYQIGDTLKEGPRVIVITRQGVVLDYNGQKFLLPRP